MGFAITSLSDRFDSMVGSLVLSIKRFPFAYLFAFITTVSLIYFIEKEPDIRNDAVKWSSVIKIILCSYIAFLGFLATRVFVETRASNKYSLLLFLIPLVISIVYYFSLPADLQSNSYSPVFRFICLSFIGHLIISTAPFTQQYNNASFWDFNKALFVNFFIATFYALVLYAGLCIALVSINYLFDYHIKSTIYADVAIAVFGLFLTHQFFVRFPSFPPVTQRAPISPLFSIFINYILIPLMCLYFLIAYGFMIKLLVDGAWPNGWVSSLVVGFIVAGTIVYLLNYGLSGKSVILSRIYNVGFKYSLIPLAILLLFAVFRRISDYGLTEERYLLIFIGIWSIITALYFIFFKKSAIVFIPLSLAFFAFILMLGAERMSISNQKERLLQNLELSGHLANGKLDLTSTIEDPGQIRAISNSINYLESRGRLSSIYSLYSAEQLLALPNDPELWQRADVLNSMGINVVDRPSFDPGKRIAFEISSGIHIDISGFDDLLMLNVPVGIENSSVIFRARLVENEIHIYDENDLLDIFPLAPVLKTLSEEMESKGFVSTKEALFNSESDVFSSSLLVQKFDIAYDNDKLNIYAFKAILLLNRK